jgi:hypothetical protein
MNMPQAKKDFDFKPHLLATYIKTYKCGIVEKMIYFKKFKARSKKPYEKGENVR